MCAMWQQKEEMEMLTVDAVIHEASLLLISIYSLIELLQAEV